MSLQAPVVSKHDYEDEGGFFIFLQNFCIKVVIFWSLMCLYMWGPKNRAQSVVQYEQLRKGLIVLRQPLAYVPCNLLLISGRFTRIGHFFCYFSALHLHC